MVDEMRTYGDSLLTNWGTKFKKGVVKRLPKWISTRKLTFINLIAAILAFVSYYLARNDLAFLWGATFFILLHGVVDTLDGEVGRWRKEG